MRDEAYASHRNTWEFQTWCVFWGRGAGGGNIVRDSCMFLIRATWMKRPNSQQAEEGALHKT